MNPLTMNELLAILLVVFTVGICLALIMFSLEFKRIWTTITEIPYYIAAPIVESGLIGILCTLLLGGAVLLRKEFAQFLPILFFAWFGITVVFLGAISEYRNWKRDKNELQKRS